MAFENESKTSLIINYLPQKLTDEEFEELFKPIGPIKSFRICRNRATNYSYGYGFVNYEDPEDAQRAIDELDGKQVMNKKIKVSLSRPGGIKYSLYVKNLPGSYTDEELKDLFSNFGTVIQARVVHSEMTTLSRCVGFVVFDKSHEAEKAIRRMNNKTPLGGDVPLVVKHSDRDEERHGRANFYGNGPDMMGNERRNFMGNRQGNMMNYMQADRGEQRHGMGNFFGNGPNMMGNERRNFMGNRQGNMMNYGQADRDEQRRGMGNFFDNGPDMMGNGHRNFMGNDQGNMMNYGQGNMFANYQGNMMSDNYQGNMMSNEMQMMGDGWGKMRNNEPGMMGSGPENIMGNNQGNMMFNRAHMMGNDQGNMMMNGSQMTTDGPRNLMANRQMMANRQQNMMGNFQNRMYTGDNTNSQMMGTYDDKMNDFTGPIRNSNMSAQNRSRYNPMGQNGNMNSRYQAKSGSDFSDAQFREQTSQGCTVFAYNVGTDCQQMDIYRLFSPYGALLKVDLMWDKAKDQCKGFAFVTFKNADEAAEAISMLNGSPYNGRTLQVRLKK